MLLVEQRTEQLELDEDFEACLESGLIRRPVYAGLDLGTGETSNCVWLTEGVTDLPGDFDGVLVIDERTGVAGDGSDHGPDRRRSVVLGASEVESPRDS